MKSTTRRKYIILVIGIAVLVAVYFITRPNTTSFKELVLDHVNVADITSIEIVKTQRSSQEEEIVVTDRNKIENIINGFARAELRQSDSGGEFSEAYWISIQENDKLRFGLRLDDQNYISISDLQRNDKYGSGHYQITNDFNSEFIRNLFN
ncbi:hypothetical protein OIN60_05695 [Paenibacillus sp. P96]|uniref:DUF4362 domain-containing protein n=1 Tax=Paenibacillus zeirhizosphaerae TaxID=2987519 RepID=A0ABT9FNE7_9BACL|nr:hypothetical protein [Paenibacillus sp. P96]MDP4096263.1 hypothetical protein [Paenibacillus sp. P96]